MSVDGERRGGSLGFSTNCTMRSSASVSAIPYCRGELEVADVDAAARRSQAVASSATTPTKRGSENSNRLSPANDAARRFQPCRLDRRAGDPRPRRADRRSSSYRRRGPRRPFASAQRSKAGAKRLFVTRWTSSTVSHLADAIEHPVEHRPAAERKQMLRHVVGQRPEAGRVARGKESPPSRQRLLVGRAMDAVLGDDRRDQRGRRDVEGGIAGREAARQLGRVALLDRDPRAVGRRRGRASRSARRRRTGSRGGRRARRASMSRSCSPCPRSRRSGRRR